MIDPDWNPCTLGWDVGWQRRYAQLADCLRGGATLDDIRPGLTVGGEDLGVWLRAQRQRWERLVPGQQARLAELGVTPAAGKTPTPRSTTSPSGARAAAWERGRAAAEQYRNREGTLDGVPRSHIETVLDTNGHQHAVKLGVWLSNQRTRRHTLTPQRAEQLRELGVL